MAQLYFRYSTMNAGKSIDLIKVAYNYEERGQTVLALVPAVDDRYGRGVITSRIGVQREATIVRDDTNILELFMKENERKHIDCVLVDESQFLRKHHIEELVEIVDSCNTPVICYGLKTICWCGRKATMVARVVDGKIVKSGDQIVVGGNDMYVSLCRKHYNDGRLGPTK